MRQHDSSDVSVRAVGTILQRQFCANSEDFLFEGRHLIYLIHPKGTKNKLVHAPPFDMSMSLFVQHQKASSIIPEPIALSKMLEACTTLCSRRSK